MKRAKHTASLFVVPSSFLCRHIGAHKFFLFRIISLLIFAHRRTDDDHVGKCDKDEIILHALCRWK